MNPELANPFYVATREVFRLMLDLEVQRGADQLKLDGLANKKACVSIGIVGDLEGTIQYNFPESMTLEMVRIMSGMEMEVVDDFVASALSEIVNIISGNAMTSLFESNYTCDILPPTLQLIEEVEERPSDKVISLPLETIIGPLRVEVDLRKKGA